MGIATLVALVGAPVLASADPQPAGGAATVTAVTPPSAVEDFAYPDADRIQREAGIKLIRGDGHIIFAACGETGSQIKVETVQGAGGNPRGTYCFKVTGKSGYLTLELPRVFALETADHPISAALRPQDDPTAKAQTVTVDKNKIQNVGEGASGGSPAVLLELRVTG